MRRARSVWERRRSSISSSGMVIESTPVGSGWRNRHYEASRMPSPPVGLAPVTTATDRGSSESSSVHPNWNTGSLLLASKKGEALRGSSGGTDNVLRVLAQGGRPTPDWGTPAVEGDGQRHEIVAELGHTLKHAEGFHLRLGKHLAQILDGRAGDAGLLERVDPLALRARGKHALDQLDQLETVRAPVAVGGEARILGPLRMAQRCRQLGEEAVVAGRDDHRTVLGLEALEGDETARACPLPRGQVAGEPVAGHVTGEQAQRGLEERGVHDTAAPRARAPMKRSEDAHGRPHAGAQVEHGRAE